MQEDEMSTPAQVNFADITGGEVAASVYRHWDGYPSAMLPALADFLTDVEAQCPGDTRFSDPQYLAAKYVVWQSVKNRGDGAEPLNFLSVGILRADESAGDYTYTVACRTDGTPGRPLITIDA
jgi:hypothetical protein